MKSIPLAAIATLALTSCQAQPWVTHNDPKGFTVQYPRGWSAQMVTAQTTRMPLIRAGGDDPRLFVLIMPFSQRDARASAAGWLKTGFPRYLSNTFPKASFNDSRSIAGPMDQAVASFDWLSNAGPARARILCSLHQGSGIAFVVSAPANQFDSRRQTLMRVLQSFSFISSGAGDATPTGNRDGPSVRYVTFLDPTEGAFSVQVPHGWRVNGGITRKYGPSVPKAYVNIASPNGQIAVRFGDPEIPPFVVPNQTLEFSGFTEGRMYSPGYGVQMMVRRYQPGVQFAQNYAGRLAQGMQGFQLKDRRERPELANYVNSLYARSNNTFMATEMTAGEVSFEAAKNGPRIAGYCLAFSQATRVAGIGNWTVEYLYSFLAPAEDAGLAAAVLTQFAKTFQVNPQWFAQALQTTANVSHIVSDTSTYISNLTSKSYWSQQATYNRISQSGSDARRGVVRVQDPATGEVYEARNGSNYYYRLRGTDTVIRSDRDDIPVKLDVTVLEQIK